MQVPLATSVEDHVSTFRAIVKAAANRVPTAATVVDYLLFAATHSPFEGLLTRRQDLLSQVYELGYAVIPHYFSPDACEQAIRDFRSISAQFPQHVQQYSDTRIYGVEALSPTIARFCDDPMLLCLANRYNGQRTVNAFTMVNEVTARPESRGSGEGWHKDSSFRQFKAFVYLNDVTSSNGAFQLIERSNKLAEYLGDMRAARLPFRQLRIDDEAVDRILQRRPERLKTLTGAPGTLLLVDTASIHRGSPPQHGVRYALTNYFMDVQQLSDRTADVYRPISRDRLARLIREARR